MTANLMQKLQTVPADKAKVEIPEGFRLSVLNFKTVDGVKRESEAWFLPMLYNPVSDVVFNRFSAQVAGMVTDLIDSEQDACLREYVVAGDLEMIPRINDLEKLAKFYFTDGRGNRTGIKQEAIVEWIDSVMVPFLTERINRNQPTTDQTKRNSLVASLVAQFKIAASRGNKVVTKGVPRSCSMELLKDLSGRLALYLEGANNNPALPAGEESKALQARINNHIATLMESASVTVETF